MLYAVHAVVLNFNARLSCNHVSIGHTLVESLYHENEEDYSAVQENRGARKQLEGSHQGTRGTDAFRKFHGSENRFKTSSKDDESSA